MKFSLNSSSLSWSEGFKSSFLLKSASKSGVLKYVKSQMIWPYLELSFLESNRNTDGTMSDKRNISAMIAFPRETRRRSVWPHWLRPSSSSDMIWRTADTRRNEVESAKRLLLTLWSRDQSCSSNANLMIKLYWNIIILFIYIYGHELLTKIRNFCTKTLCGFCHSHPDSATTSLS